MRLDSSPIPKTSGFPPPAPPSPLARVPAAPTAAAPPSSQSGRDPERFLPIPGVGAGVGVELSRRDGGVEVVQYIDLRTGAVLFQNPPEQVLAMVADVIASIEQRERADGRR